MAAHRWGGGGSGREEGQDSGLWDRQGILVAEYIGRNRDGREGQGKAQVQYWGAGRLDRSR